MYMNRKCYEQTFQFALYMYILAIFLTIQVSIFHVYFSKLIAL